MNRILVFLACCLSLAACQPATPKQVSEAPVDNGVTRYVHSLQADTEKARDVADKANASQRQMEESLSSMKEQ